MYSKLTGIERGWVAREGLAGGIGGVMEIRTTFLGVTLEKKIVVLFLFGALVLRNSLL